MMTPRDFSIRRPTLILLGIFILALGLRLWGINFGLPYLYHPDEGALVMPALNILRTGDFRPLRLDYGSVYIYSLTALYIPYFLYGAWHGTFKSLDDLPVYADYHQIGQYPFPGLFLLGRLLTVILGGLTVLVLYSLGNRLIQQPIQTSATIPASGQNSQTNQDGLIRQQLGLAAAILLAILPLHVQNSHFATTDIPMVFFLTLALTRILDVFDYGRWRDYFWAGLLVGLTASTKFPGGIALSALLTAHVLRARNWSELFDKRLAFSIAVTVGGFLLGTPYALDLRYFLNWLAVNVSFYGNSTGGPGATVQGSTALYYFKELFLSPSSGPLAVLGIIGLSLFLRQSWRRGIVLVIFPLLYTILISLQAARYNRFLIPLLPFLALGAAQSLIAGAEWLAHQHSAVRPGLGLIGLIALVNIYPLFISIKSDALIAGPDVRTQALQWCNANIPPEAKIAADPGGPPLIGTHNVYLTWNFTQHSPDWYIEQNFAYLVISEPRIRDPNLTLHDASIYQELMSRFELVKTFEGSLFGSEGWHIWVYRVTP